MKNFDINKFTEAINKASLNYESDISWGYRYKDENYVVDFYKTEQQKNIVEQFCYNHNGLWVAIEPTDEQLKLMFTKLNETPYRPVEPIGETEEFNNEHHYFF